MGDYIEPADLAEADANAADYPTVAAQQCGIPEGLDATDMDMIRRGDMLGSNLGARVASLIQSQAAELSAVRGMLTAALGKLQASNDHINRVDRILRNSDLHETTRVVDAQDAISAARSLLNGERKG